MKRREVISGTAGLASLVAGSGCASFHVPTSATPPERSYVGEGNWPMARADRHNSGGISTELDWDVLSADELISQADTNRRRVSALTFADGYLVAVAGDRTVMVWDVERREEVWRRETDRAVTTDPAVANESVYVPTESAILAFELQSGERRWATDVTSLDLPLLSTGDRLVVEDKPASEIVGLDPRSGDRVWSSSVDHSPRGVAVAGKRAFVTQRGEAVGVVTAHSVHSGRQRWRREFDPIDVFPTVAGDRVVVGTKAGTVLALQRSDGETIWTNQTTAAREGHFLPLAADGRTVYVPPNNGEDVVALSLEDGTKRWRTPASQSDTSVALTKERVLYAQDGLLTVYGKADGADRRSWEFQTTVLAVCPTVAGVFVAAKDRVLQLG